MRQLVRQSCASETGNNRIQPDKKPLQQAKSRPQSGAWMMWIIVFLTVYVL